MLKTEKASFGVSALLLNSKEHFSINGEVRYPMASVYKFAIALAVLKQNEKNSDFFSQKIAIDKSDIRGGYKGPIAIQFPEGGVKLSSSTLLQYMIANSDNTASDLLLKSIGGPASATQILSGWGFNKISIDRYEKDLIVQKNDPGKSDLDTASPNELVNLLAKFFKGDLLNKKNTTILTALMKNTGSAGHIAKGLPSGTPLLSRSGWCAADKCINDIAVITLPNGKDHLALAVLVSGHINETKAISQMIGQIARLTYASAVEK